MDDDIDTSTPLVSKETIRQARLAAKKLASGEDYKQLDAPHDLLGFVVSEVKVIFDDDPLHEFHQDGRTYYIGIKKMYETKKKSE